MKRKRMRAAGTAFLLVLAASMASAATWYVSPSGNDSNPGTQGQPYATVQAGINAAQEGDTVSLANGTYEYNGNYNLGISNKSISIIGPGGPENCIIDAHGLGACVLGESGGGTLFQGIRFANGSANNPQYIFSGGVTLLGGSNTFRQCEFNQCFSNGKNARGGAVWVSSGVQADFQDCTFTNNTATGGGSAVFVSGPTTLERCTLSGNSGAVIFTARSSIQAVNCVFQSNHSTAMNINSQGNSITHCTFTANQGPAISNVSAQDTTSITNSIFWGDSGGEITGNYIAYYYTVTHCDVQQSAGVVGGAGNLNVDPLFVSATDARLQAGSPCINAGTQSISLPPTDITGVTPRSVGTAPDMGAYELMPDGTLFVDKIAGSDANPGTPAAPLQTVTHAVSVATPDVDIFVRAASYPTDHPRVTKNVHIKKWTGAGSVRIGAK